MEAPIHAYSLVDKVLLVCGILATLVWFATEGLAGILWKGYSFVSQSINELSAANSVTRAAILPFNLLFDGLMLAFSLGIWRLAGEKRALLIMAALMAANALISIVGVSVVPMQINGLKATASMLNVILGAIGMFCFVLAIVFGAAAFRNWFRWLSIGILVLYVGLTVAGILLSRGAPAGALARVGVQERTMVYMYLGWVVALAVLFLQVGLPGLARIISTAPR